MPHGKSVMAITQLVLFELDERRYALPLEVVEQVVSVVEITPLPNAPAAVLGVINVRGEIVPVFDVRQRFGLDRRQIEVTDQLLIATTATRRVAILSDRVTGLVELQVLMAESIVPELEGIQGITTVSNQIILVQDLDKFLSAEQEEELQASLAFQSFPGLSVDE